MTEFKVEEIEGKYIVGGGVRLSQGTAYPKYEGIARVKDYITSDLIAEETAHGDTEREAIDNACHNVKGELQRNPMPARERGLIMNALMALGNQTSSDA